MRNATTAAPALPHLTEPFDALEEAFRLGVRSYLQELLELEVTEALGRLRHGRQPDAKGYRHGRRERTLVGRFGRVTLDVPRARLQGEDGRMCEHRSALLPRYRRLTVAALSLIASAYLAGVNTRRVRRALGALFGGAVSKDSVSRAWRILDGTVVRLRLDRKATTMSVLVVMGVRADGQKVLLALQTMAGESQAAWREVLDDLVGRGLRVPQLLIIDGGKGLEAALAGLWPSVPVQRCTVHKHRNLLAHAPRKLHAEIGADYTDMIYAKTVAEVKAKRRAFLRKWKLKCRAVADSLEEAGDRLFTFLRYPETQWRSIRTTNAIERLHEEFKRRIKTQCLLPCAQSASMLFWGLLASGQIALRKVDGWQSLAQPPAPLDLAA